MNTTEIQKNILKESNPKYKSEKKTNFLKNKKKRHFF